MTGFRDLARNHDFTVLWIGSTISQLGSSMSSFAFPLVGYAMTHSAVIASLAEAAYLLGTLAMLLPAGVLADRHDRGSLMRWSAATGIVAFGSLAVAGACHVLTVPQLLIVALASGLSAGLFLPAESAAVRVVVSTEDLPVALSQQQARQHIAGLLGAPVAGLLYAAARWVPFLADAVSYAVQWVLLRRLRTPLPGRTDASASKPWTDIVEGWRFLARDGFFRTLLLWAPLANLTVNAVFYVATLRLIQAGFPAWQIGLVGASAGLIGILGALCAPRIIERVPTGVLVLVGAWAFVPLLAPMAWRNDPLVVGTALAAGIFVNPAGNAAIGSYAQALLPTKMMGRFSSTMGFTAMSTMPLAPLLAGGLLSGFGGRSAVLLLAAACGLVALIPTASRAMWAIPRPAQWDLGGGSAETPATADASR